MASWFPRPPAGSPGQPKRAAKEDVPFESTNGPVPLVLGTTEDANKWVLSQTYAYGPKKGLPRFVNMPTKQGWYEQYLMDNTSGKPWDTIKIKDMYKQKFTEGGRRKTRRRLTRHRRTRRRVHRV